MAWYKIFHNLNKKYSTWYIFVLILLIAFIGRYIVRKTLPIREKFTKIDKFELKEGDDVFDSFYVNYYDELLYNGDKNNYEIGKINETTNLTNESRVLDIGSGTGHHLNLLADLEIPAIGLDKSRYMTEYASATYPKLDFQTGDALTKNYPSGSFSHIFILYFTVYYFKDKKTLFENCYKWLAPGGYLILHLVNKHKFNPVIPKSNVIRNVNLQKYKDGRIIKSITKIDDFNYTSEFILENRDNTTESIFTEKFIDKYSQTRQNNHILYMEKQSEILTLVKNIGFILESKIDMDEIDYTDQYLYILKKPE